MPLAAPPGPLWTADAKEPHPGAGDTWTWTAIDADSKLIVSWLLGERDGQAAYDFMMDLAERLASRAAHVGRPAALRGRGRGRFRRGRGLRAAHQGVRRPAREERTVQPGDVQGNVLRNHAAALALYFVFYNFCRVHKTLRMSPAMAGGLTDTLRDAEWIVGLIDAAAPAPGPRGPYKKRATVPISS